MKKTPTIFLRDHNNGLVVPEINPAAAWVFDQARVAVRKYDGTCVGFFPVVKGELRIHGGIGSHEINEPEELSGVWLARREVKKNKTAPAGFIPEQTDEVTGKTVGWIPIEDSSFYKMFNEAVTTVDSNAYFGTYELCGPKVNGNPEGFKKHVLVRHWEAEQLADVQVLDFHEMDVTDAYEALRRVLGWLPVEGAIFRHPDGRLAKLKKKDFKYDV